MKIRTIVATAGLATVVTLGAGTAAFAADAPTGTAPTPEQVAKRCAKAPATLERLDAAQTRVQERIARLTEARTKAEADGTAKRVERLGAAIERLQGRLDKLTSTETRVRAWSDLRCSAAA